MKTTKKAFTFFETVMMMLVISIIAVILISNLRPATVKEDALIKAGGVMYIQIDYAITQIIATKAKNYTLTSLMGNDASTFVENYLKKFIKSSRSYSISSTYKNSTFKNSSGTAVGSSLKVSNFTGFSINNGGYIGVRLYGGCTTSESYLYNPSKPTARTQSNSCGQIFFDVNGEDIPNIMGVDQYLVSLTANGVR